MNEPTFTEDWSTHMRTIWPKHILPLLHDLPEIHWLEVGSFEGRSTLWTIENLLRGPSSTITCVDVWEVWPWHRGVHSPFDYEATFDHNVAGRPQVRKLKGKSSDILPTLPAGHFHGAFVDGSHETKDVIDDARLVLSKLRHGGIMVFDDYQEPTCPGVKPGVDAFMTEHRDLVKVVHLGQHAIFRLRGR